MPKAGSRSRSGDPSAEYASWDRQAATARALAHASSSQAVDRSGTGGVWNFAFGSNMLPAKVAERSMMPLHVVRGSLPGWRLLFNHRGGYGNIETVAAIAEQGLELKHLSPDPEPEEPQPEPEQASDDHISCASSSCSYLAHSTQTHGYCCKACMRSGGHGAACEQIEASLQPLEALPPDEVHGALLLLTHEEFGRLASEEYGYNTIEVVVQVYDEDLATSYAYNQLSSPGRKQQVPGKRPKIGGTIHALAFKSSSCAVVDASTLPSTRYIGMLRDGAATLRLDRRYCAWLEKVPSRKTVH